MIDFDDVTHHFIMKTWNKREHQQIAFNHSSDTNFAWRYKST